MAAKRRDCDEYRKFKSMPKEAGQLEEYCLPPRCLASEPALRELPKGSRTDPDLRLNCPWMVFLSHHFIFL